MFFDDLLIRNTEAGYRISTPLNTPEEGGLMAGASMEDQIIRDLFLHVDEVGQVFKLDTALSKYLMVKGDRIKMNRIGKYGQLEEWVRSLDYMSNKHRHL